MQERTKRGEILGVAAFGTYVIGSAILAPALFWSPYAPNPDHAMILVFGYLIAMIASCAALALILGWLEDGSGASRGPRNPPTPPGLSAAGLPVGPRHPKPLVSHAEAA